MCRNITRPARSEARVQYNAAGQVVLKLKNQARRHHEHRDGAAGPQEAASLAPARIRDRLLEGFQPRQSSARSGSRR